LVVAHAPFIGVFQRNGRGLIPDLQHVIVMLGLQQKGKFYFGTFGLDDALHLFRGIPNRHIAAPCSWSARWGRITDVNQKFLGHTLEAQPAKVCLKREAIERLCHGSFLSHTSET